jgi:hypothetical protein
VGLSARHLIDRPPNGLLPVLGSDRLKILAGCTPQVGQVRQRPASVVIVLDSDVPPGGGVEGGGAYSGLDGGLLVGGDPLCHQSSCYCGWLDLWVRFAVLLAGAFTVGAVV